ncbi:MAG: bifunctional metallophosphatase/5'-nucleotidase [Armatimonadetes bacterium]|nr:bifunctional metallophosphatase/5'-nucleotidase [Armatimonadota bacterium]
MRHRWLLLLLLWLSPTVGAESIYILHTNDLHGHLRADEQEPGGLDRIGTILKVWRRSFPGRVVVLDAGDIAQGTLVSNLARGAPMIDALEAAGYDAVVPGNHEFDWGPEGLTEILAPGRLPVVCANLVAEDGSSPYPAYRLIERGGVQIGVIGLITPETPSATAAGNTRGYRFLDPVQAVKDQLPALRKAGADVLIVLSHLGVEADRSLARSVPELDLIVGGHSHTQLAQGLREAGVPIVQTGCNARFLGLVEIELEGGRAAGAEARLIPVDREIPADPEIAAIVERYQEELGFDARAVIAQAAEPIPLEPRPGHVDGPLGSLLADVLRAETGAQVALFNHGGIRAALLPSGPITRERAFRLLPFDDPVVKLQVSGQGLLEALRHGLFSAPGAVQVSGLTAVLDPRNETVLEVRVDGAPLDPARQYTVAVPGFMAGGGDGYVMLREGLVLERYPIPRELFERYARRAGALRKPEPGRLRNAHS